jgi:hypothetical protein
VGGRDGEEAEAGTEGEPPGERRPPAGHAEVAADERREDQPDSRGCVPEGGEQPAGEHHGPHHGIRRQEGRGAQFRHLCREGSADRRDRGEREPQDRERQ